MVPPHRWTPPLWIRGSGVVDDPERHILTNSKLCSELLSDDTSDGPGAMLCSSLDGVIASSRSELIYPRLKRVSISLAERKVQNLERPPDHNKVPRRASCASSMIAACWPSVSLLLLIVSAALATPSPPTCPAGATAAPI